MPLEMDLSSYALLHLRGGDLPLYRGIANGVASALIVVAENSSPEYLGRLEHEYELSAHLDADWAVRPVALARHNDRLALVLEDPGGVPLDRLLAHPLDPAGFLRIAIPLVSALGRAHARGLIHKDIRPANVLHDSASGGTWLTGFGIASRLPREHRNPEAPDTIAGSLAYMAPEQTGRMNRSIDARSDLYSLGVTFYEMLTGTLPFTASDSLGWVHCHIARRPIPPGDRIKGMSQQLSAMVMKLLAKTAEERYQTAAGIEIDLRQCLADLESRGRIDRFPLGMHDSSDRLLIPEKLYGREREIEALLAAYDRVVTHGSTQLVLVSGYAGIGKSSVVNELHKALVPMRGLFASGKFDQYKRDIPYATVAQASQSLVRSLLSRGEAELGRWRESIREALGPNGGIVVNLVPELELIIGTQPPMPELAASDARRLFKLVLRRFLGVFARKEHPLTLFLDDLQWLDEAMLDFLEDLTTSPDMRYLLVIGAYRDNEVDHAHPLMRKLGVIRRAGASVQEIVLAPLLIQDLVRLLVDSLHCEPEPATSLAQLVHDKTGGNPFFGVQFISSLVEEGLLTFDHTKASWSWDMSRIRAKGYSDNVADLMVRKVHRLLPKTQRALQQLACLGNRAELEQLSMISDDPEAMHDDLREAVGAGLILPSIRGYRFLHDRVQEAGYSLIPDDARAIAHLRIGRLLESRTAPAKIEDDIFEIVSQLNRGRHLISSSEERDRVAELNWIAGRRAKAGSAYASALSYFSIGCAMLSRNSWQHQFRLTFNLELNRAECEYITGDKAVAERRLDRLSQRASKLSDIAAVIAIQVELYTNLEQIERGIETCVAFLRRVGQVLPIHPSDDEVLKEYEILLRRIGDRSIESLSSLPSMSDAKWRTVMYVMGELAKPAGLLDTNLMDLTTLRMSNLSLEHGNSDDSSTAYAFLGMALGRRFGEYHLGYRFGQLGVTLVDKCELIRQKARVYATFGCMCLPWGRHIHESYAYSRRACEAGMVGGDLTFSSFAWWTRVASRFDCGHALAEVESEAASALAFLRRTQFVYAANLTTPILRLVRVLRGLTPKFGSFNDGEFDEARFESYIEGRPFTHNVSKYWIRKLQARFFAEEYASALAAAERVERELVSYPHVAASFDHAEYHFYTALSHAAVALSKSIDEKSRHLRAIDAHQKTLLRWELNCTANFTNHRALVGAEIARLEGRHLEAERLYEQAIASAREHGFIQNEGLAFELAARFYRARGFEAFSTAYLRNARSCYLRWGADGKVRHMDLQYPESAPPLVTPSGLDLALGPSGAQLDIATVVNVSQAIAGEMDLSKLVSLIMLTAMEHSGAARGLLILARGNDMRIEAEAATIDDGVLVRRSNLAITSSALPESVFDVVVRTKDSVLLDNAGRHGPYSADSYVQKNNSRSILCLPLIRRGRLIGALYLENGRSRNAFMPARVTVLKLLASLAATSLENARLYSDLRDAEGFLSEAQRLSHTGSFKLDISDGSIFWSEEAYRIHELDRSAELSLERLFKMIHPDDLPEIRELVDRKLRRKENFEFEYRIRVRDTYTKYLQIVAHAVTDEAGELRQFVGAIRDVTSFKQAQERLRKAQADLAKAGRLTTMGELAASIAHEVTQPLMAIVTNAESCLLWLAKQEPNRDRARDAAERIVRNGRRADDIIKSIRALASRSAPERVLLDLNAVIRDTLDLMHPELRRHDISLETRFTYTRAAIKGDKTQLQQVMTNLIMNGVEAMSSPACASRVFRIFTFSDHDGHVMTSVEDSGPGIDAELLERIFDPLFTTKSEGMGLGLSICRSIIETHGGRLWASANPAGGSIFRFSIPAAAHG